MSKTMSDCYGFWALYICLNENGQEKNEAEAQNWLDWMKKLAKEEEQLQRTEQEPEQEPVAWNSGVQPLYPQIKDGETISVEYLETTPQPQRTWVGLTDEETIAIELCLRIPTGHGDAYDLSLRDFARAIEAKLKELNS